MKIKSHVYSMNLSLIYKSINQTSFYVILLFISFSACNDGNRKDLTNFVNPFIGTDYFGHAFPGPALPFGLVHVSPDIDTTGWNWKSGYHYSGKSIMGFSQLHSNGGGGDILMMPTIGNSIKTFPGSRNNPDEGYRSRFSHKEEKASPGYYEVMLKDYHIKAELTATRRVGFHKFIFPESKDAHILIDLGHGVRNHTKIAHIKINVDENELEGYRKSTNGSKVYFVAKFNKKFKTYGTWDNTSNHHESDVETKFPFKTAETGTNIGAFVNYHTDKGEAIFVKIGVSFTSIEGARKNIGKEIANWDFDKTKNNDRAIWNRELSKIKVEGGTNPQKIIFYTALYHALLYQYISNDVDGNYFGMDKKIHKKKRGDFYPKFQAWDTFRSEQPLMTLIEPHHIPDMIESIIDKYNHFGWLPAQHSRNLFGEDMIGDHLVPIIADSYIKGISGYDIKAAYKAIKQKALHYPINMDSSIARSGLKYYKKLGYVPANRVKESVSKTLEYSYDDWCIAQIAKKMNKKNDFNHFMKRALYYKNVYDSTTGFMRPKNANGTWLKKCNGKKPEINTDGYNSYYSCFDPLFVGVSPYRHYTESNAWQYLWYVPQNVQGLITMMGGIDNFTNRLDHFFSMSPEITGPKYIGVVGTIGQYVHGNEPDQQVPYLYDYAGVPWKTQKTVRKVMNDLYSADAGGLSGNADAGAMSSWYVFSAMGFYPVCPGRSSYEIGSPIFKKIIIHIGGPGDSKKFVIRAKNVSSANKYIQSATLNGRLLKKAWIKHSEIISGGTMTFIMGNKPNKKWANKTSMAPPSMTIK